VQRSLIEYSSKDLRRVAEERIERFLEQYSPKWLYVDWSGGKDSTAVLAAAVSAAKDMVVATFLHLAGQTVHDNAKAVLEVARRLGLNVFRYAGMKSPRELYIAMLRDRPWESAPALVYVVTTAHGMDYWSATLKYGFEAPIERLGGGKRWACSEFKGKWLAARPPNGRYRGRPARFLLVGIRRAESPYRAKLWRDTSVKVFGERYQKVPDVALAPIIDFVEPEVWHLLQLYGLRDAVEPQYVKWGGRAPNCALCPLMNRANFARALRNLPTGYLERALAVLREVRRRYRDSTFSAKKIDEWIPAIEAELERRRGAGGRAPSPTRFASPEDTSC